MEGNLHGVRVQSMHQYNNVLMNTIIYNIKFFHCIKKLGYQLVIPYNCKGTLVDVAIVGHQTTFFNNFNAINL